jgi:hypothetical protein
MVTNWDLHWNDPKYNPYYSLTTLKGSMNKNKLVENTPTLFINRNKLTQGIVGVWEGTVHDFKFGKSKKGQIIIRFKQSLERSVKCPPEYASYAEGWHVEETPSYFPAEANVQSDLFPPFFETLRTTKDWNLFEGLCYKLFKVLGIHEIHRFKEQRGKPDGFFKIGSMAVIYDATLETDFEVSKKEQIRNYCNQLASGLLDYEDGTVNVRDCSKNVWIITQSNSRRITKMDSVAVNEVTVSDLMRVYRERVEKNLSEDQLVSDLGNIALPDKTTPS